MLSRIAQEGLNTNPQVVVEIQYGMSSAELAS
jgi:hypothetical protein